MLFVLAVLLCVHISLVGCGKKKKNAALDLKPRDMSLVDKTQGEKSAPDSDKPKKGNGTNMKAREADDNETINDAKSEWGAIPPKTE